MKGMTLVMAVTAVAVAVGVAAWSKGREPGADMRWVKTSDEPAKFVKSQARLCPEGEPAPEGCERGAE